MLRPLLTSWCIPESPHTREDARLTTHIQQVFVSFRGVYGSPRIHAELQDQGCVNTTNACLFSRNQIYCLLGNKHVR
ncbi:IS3 family transposase [Dictyobacter formicarum]|uniref:IS3 family transposase n=1 Tax=Dictyobacter formicarum TaxID=2778368 RepID=UPI003570C60E